MTISTAARPKLSIRNRPSIDGIVPLPDFDRGLERSRRREDTRSVVDALRHQAAEVEAQTGRIAARSAACENGDGHGDGIASFLAPVLDHFEMGEADARELANFTRKLMSGGRPKRGSSATALRNVDLD